MQTFKQNNSLIPYSIKQDAVGDGRQTNVFKSMVTASQLVDSTGYIE